MQLLSNCPFTSCYSNAQLRILLCCVEQSNASIGEEIKRERMAPCPSKALNLGEVFRLDAKAEGEQVAVGGWRCRGAASTHEASWFAVKLNRRNAPWAFTRGEAFRTIASLELLGGIAGLAQATV